MGTANNLPLDSRATWIPIGAACSIAVLFVGLSWSMATDMATIKTTLTFMREQRTGDRAWFEKEFEKVNKRLAVLEGK